MTQHTKPGDSVATQEREETDRPSRAKRVVSAANDRVGNGTVAGLAGGLLLAGAARTATRNRRSAGALAVGAAALFGVARRQRRSGKGMTGEQGDEATGRDASEADDGSTKVSAEAYAHRMGSDMVDKTTETNPRGVADEPDVDTETAPGEGRIRFSTGQDEATAQKPHLDRADPKDPRYPDEGEPGAEDPVDVSLSSTKMTGELGKVAGPDDDQAYPSFEGTDPEPMTDEAPPRYGERDGETPDLDSDGEDDQAGDAAGTDDASDDDREREGEPGDDEEATDEKSV